MPISMNFAGVDLSRITVRPDPLAELGAFLHAISFREHHPLAEPLLETAALTDPNGVLRQQLNRFLPLYGPLRSRCLFPLDSAPEPASTISAQLGFLADLPIELFMTLVADSLTEDAGRPISSHIRSSPQEQAQFFRRVERISLSRLELARDLILSPETVRWHLIDFLQAAWSTWMRPLWRASLPKLARHAEILQARLVAEGIHVLAERIPEVTIATPELAVIDKVYNDTVPLAHRRLIIVPSALVSPHLHIQFAAGLPVVLQYDVEAPSTPLVAEVFERIQTLADPVRLGICRMILRRPSTTIDIAEELRTTSPLISRHLRRLREAGLVRTQRQGKHVYYSLNTETIASLGPHFLTTLRR